MGLVEIYPVLCDIAVLLTLLLLMWPSVAKKIMCNYKPPPLTKISD